MGLVAGWAMVMVPWHFGALHPAEKPLAFALAIAPFVVLFVVIAIRRRQDGAAEEARQAPPPTVDEHPAG
jgi:hypothetical protein